MAHDRHAAAAFADEERRSRPGDVPMLMPLIVLFQAAGPVLPDRLRVGRSCPVAEAGADVVVCGRRDQERYRLHPLPPRDEATAIPRAEMRVGKGTAGVRAEDAGVGGFTSHRAMVGIKLPF